MRRRELIAGLVCASAVWPAIPRAQRSQVNRIGALVIGNADVPGFQKELREGLRELGRIEERDYVVELRSAEGQLGRLPELAAELVRLKVDVIVALYTPCAVAAKQATRDIAIVIIAGDPIGSGLVESLSRPGANVTGLSTMGAETHAKCVELFHDMLPSARRIAVIANAADPVFCEVLCRRGQASRLRDRDRNRPRSDGTWTGGARSGLRQRREGKGGCRGPASESAEQTRGRARCRASSPGGNIEPRLRRDRRAHVLRHGRAGADPPLCELRA